MDAKIDEIKSKFYTAQSNVKTIIAAYNHAIETGLGDQVFQDMTAGTMDLFEIITLRLTLWINKSVPDFLENIRLAEVKADEALKDSEEALKIMQVAFTAAPERKRAREEEGKTKENEAEEGEASNQPGGSNA